MPERPCKKVRLWSLPQVFCLWTPRCLALLGWYQRVWYQGVTFAKQKLFSLISLENIPKENQLEVLLYSKNGCSLKSGIAHLASNVLSAIKAVQESRVPLWYIPPIFFTNRFVNFCGNPMAILCQHRMGSLLSDYRYSAETLREGLFRVLPFEEKWSSPPGWTNLWLTGCTNLSLTYLSSKQVRRYRWIVEIISSFFQFLWAANLPIFYSSTGWWFGDFRFRVITQEWCLVVEASTTIQLSPIWATAVYEWMHPVKLCKVWACLVWEFSTQLGNQKWVDDLGPVKVNQVMMDGWVSEKGIIYIYICATSLAFYEPIRKQWQNFYRGCAF